MFSPSLPATLLSCPCPYFLPLPSCLFLILSSSSLSHFSIFIVPSSFLTSPLMSSSPLVSAPYFLFLIISVLSFSLLFHSLSCFIHSIALSLSSSLMIRSCLCPSRFFIISSFVFYLFCLHPFSSVFVPFDILLFRPSSYAHVISSSFHIRCKTFSLFSSVVFCIVLHFYLFRFFSSHFTHLFVSLSLPSSPFP